MLEADLTADLGSSVLVVYDVDADSVVSCGAIETDASGDDSP